MAPPKPTATIDIGDGKQRTITFDFAVAWQFEDDTGISFDQIGDSGSMSAKNLALLLASMLREYDPQVDAWHVARHLHPGNMGEVMAKVNEVIGSAQETSEDGGESEGGQHPSG